MFQTRNARRVVAIADATLESQLLGKLVELGVRGYNAMPSGGKGTRLIRGVKAHR